MNRRRMLNAPTTAQDIGNYEDAAVIPAETDPRSTCHATGCPSPST